MHKIKKYQGGGAPNLTSNPQVNKFKISDFLNIGNPFGTDQSIRGANASGAISNIVAAAGEGAMNYAMASKGGRTGFQKGQNTGNALVNSAISGIGMIPGVGTAASLALTGLNWGAGKLSKNANKISLSEDVGSSSAYTGLASQVGDQIGDRVAFNSSGFTKLFGGGNRRKLNERTAQLKGFQRTASNIVQNSKKKMAALGNTAQNIGMQNAITFNSPPTVAIGKNGLNTNFLKEFRTFKKGGKVEVPQNVIVDGKLHKELNHMADVVDIDITRKGIPVLAMEKGGELGDQMAELERDEIILHLQLTKKLEELAKENTDESMIEAGKILSKEILKNTKDSRNKLLKTVA